MTPLRLYVWSAQAGLVFGASGNTIRWLQRESQTHLKMEKRSDIAPDPTGRPERDHRLILVYGPPERQQHCRQLIQPPLGV